MNGTYYQNPTFPSNNYVVQQEAPSASIQLKEQSYIENILRMNVGKKIKAYVSYPDSSAWQNKVYEGIIEAAGKDHIIIRDHLNNNWYLIRIIYLNYVEFNEPISYQYII